MRDHEYVAEVLRRRTQKARAADVNLLDESVELRVRIVSALAEGIEVHDDDVNRADLMRPEAVEVVRAVPPGEDAGKNRRVQGLDPAVHHFGEPGHVGHVPDGDPGRGDRPRGTPGRYEFDAQAGESTGEGLEAGFIGNA